MLYLQTGTAEAGLEGRLMIEANDAAPKNDLLKLRRERVSDSGASCTIGSADRGDEVGLER